MPSIQPTLAIRPRQANLLSRLAARFSFGLLLASVMAVPALAQSAVSKSAASVPAATMPAVGIVLTQSKVVKAADGKEQLIDAVTVKPGDIIEYKATYTNRSDKPVKGLEANLPIPDGLQYIPNSAKPGAAMVKAATKNGVYAAEPLTVKVGTKTEPVPYAEYRMLRWSLGVLPAKGEAAVSVRAKVQTNAAPAAIPAAIPASGAAAPQAPPVTVVRVPAKP